MSKINPNENKQRVFKGLGRSFSSKEQNVINDAVEASRPPWIFKNPRGYIRSLPNLFKGSYQELMALLYPERRKELERQQLLWKLDVLRRARMLETRESKPSKKIQLQKSKRTVTKEQRISELTDQIKSLKVKLDKTNKKRSRGKIENIINRLEKTLKKLDPSIEIKEDPKSSSETVDKNKDSSTEKLAPQSLDSSSDSKILDDDLLDLNSIEIEVNNSYVAKAAIALLKKAHFKFDRINDLFLFRGLGYDLEELDYEDGEILLKFNTEDKELDYAKDTKNVIETVVKIADKFGISIDSENQALIEEFLYNFGGIKAFKNDDVNFDSEKISLEVQALDIIKHYEKSFFWETAAMLEHLRNQGFRLLVQPINSKNDELRVDFKTHPIFNLKFTHEKTKKIIEVPFPTHAFYAVNLEQLEKGMGDGRSYKLKRGSYEVNKISNLLNEIGLKKGLDDKFQKYQKESEEYHSELNEGKYEFLSRASRLTDVTQTEDEVEIREKDIKEIDNLLSAFNYLEELSEQNKKKKISSFDKGILKIEELRKITNDLKTKQIQRFAKVTKKLLETKDVQSVQKEFGSKLIKNLVKEYKGFIRIRLNREYRCVLAPCIDKDGKKFFKLAAVFKREYGDDRDYHDALRPSIEEIKRGSLVLA